MLNFAIYLCHQVQKIEKTLKDVFSITFSLED